MTEYFSWYLIYEHIMESPDDYFVKDSDPPEVLSCNKKHKYSVLGLVEDHLSLFRHKGKFEFKLEYPELNKSNHWTQSVFPTKAKYGEGNGYREIKCEIKKNNWGGLALSERTETYIDGSPKAFTWYYPIGQNAQYYEGYDCLPNPEYDGDNISCLSTTRLWIKRYQKSSS